MPREQSPNLLTARNAVLRRDETGIGDVSDVTADYMDAAIPIFGGGNAFIIYILDNRDTVSGLNEQLFVIIMQALFIGLLISVLLSFLLSKTMVDPIEKLTAGAERVAAGDFGSALPVESTDEIGILTGTFNEMAGVLQTTLAAVENERNKLGTLQGGVYTAGGAAGTDVLSMTAGTLTGELQLHVVDQLTELSITRAGSSSALSSLSLRPGEQVLDAALALVELLREAQGSPDQQAEP